MTVGAGEALGAVEEAVAESRRAGLLECLSLHSI